MIRKILIGFVLTVLVSLYMFPFSFTFLPKALNTKIFVAVFGIIIFVLGSIRNGAMKFSEYTLFGGLIAAIFSVWCFFCITVDNSDDTTYAEYIVSYVTWICGAYGVYAVLRQVHGSVDIAVLTRYLALVAVFQCVTAVLIDNVPAFSNFVDRFMYQEEDYYKVHHRVYGIGAALDPAGIRFSTILLMISHQISTNEKSRSETRFLATYMIAFATTVIVGSVISRTTLVGASMALVYIVISLVKMRKGGFITTQMVRLYALFFLVLLGIVTVSIYMYNHNDTFKDYLRFGFEAFFNWVETGEFRTDSTDTLNETMWVWPDNARTWLIGRGTFGVYDNYSDIGYCNFTLYCGLIGMVIFSTFFIYCHLILNRKFRNFWIMSLMLIALTFIIWVKVTTDIFFLNALLFCIEGDYEEPDKI